MKLETTYIELVILSLELWFYITALCGLLAMYSIVYGMCICGFWACVGAYTGTTGFDIILNE